MATVKVEIPDEKIAEYVAMEQAVHPWMDDKIARRIVLDELANDPAFYERAEGEVGEEEESEAPEEEKE